jgi:RNA polymerase sigma factor (sigma-70 family)
MRLSEEWIHLVPMVAKKFFTNFAGDWEELLREGELALLQAEKRYEPERGTFKTFAFVCIQNRMTSFVRRDNQRYEREKPLEIPVDEYDVGACIPDPLEALDQIEQLIPDPEERRFLMAKFGYEMRLNELGKAFGISPSTACQRGRNLLAKVRRKAMGEP